MSSMDYAQYTQYLQQQGYVQQAPQAQVASLSPEEQMQQYNAQLKQYEDYQQAIQQAHKTPEEVLYEQQMYEYQNQVKIYEQYQKELADYETQKVEWDKQQTVYGQTFFGQSVLAATGQTFSNFGAQPQTMTPVNGVSAFGRTVRMATSRTISLPLSHMSMLRSKKSEIEIGAKARLTIMPPAAQGEEFDVMITSGTSASLDIAVALIERQVTRPTSTTTSTSLPVLKSSPVPGVFFLLFFSPFPFSPSLFPSSLHFFSLMLGRDRHTRALS